MIAMRGPFFINEEGEGLGRHYVVYNRELGIKFVLSNNEAEAFLLLSTLNVLAHEHKHFNVVRL